MLNVADQYAMDSFKYRRAIEIKTYTDAITVEETETDVQVPGMLKTSWVLNSLGTLQTNLDIIRNDESVWKAAKKDRLDLIIEYEGSIEDSFAAETETFALYAKRRQLEERLKATIGTVVSSAASAAGAYFLK